MLPEGGESPPEFFLPRLVAGAAALGLLWDDRACDLMARYLARLDGGRRRTNLTGPFPAEELVVHALESALVAPRVPAGVAIDVGAGAGFPGAPIAIVRPDVAVVPVEPRRLRREFLDGCGRELPVSNLLASRPSLAQVAASSADSGFARAVGGLGDVIGDAAFLKPGGLFFAWTTDPVALARELMPALEAEDVLPVPGSHRKTIARFRRR